MAGSQSNLPARSDVSIAKLADGVSFRAKIAKRRGSDDEVFWRRFPVTLTSSLVKIQDAERSGTLAKRRSRHRAVRHLMIARGWFGRLGLLLGVIVV